MAVMDLAAAQGLAVSMAQAAAQIPGFTAKATKVVATSRIIRAINSRSPVIRATRSN